MKILFGAILIFIISSCTKLPVDLTEEDRINAYIPAESIIDWTKTYGGTGNDYFVHFDKTTDGGYVYIGITNSFGAGLNDVYLLKTDANGVIEWYKTFGGSDYDNGYFIKQTNDGGYIITGDTRLSGSITSDIYLVKTDNSGNKEWEKTYGNAYTDGGKYVYQTSDGGFFIVSVLGDPGATGYFIKVGVLGDTVWTKKLGFIPLGANITSDSGYIIASTAGLLKIDGNGNYIWNASISSLSVTQASDNSYYALYGNRVSRVLEDGTVSWTKAYIDSSQYSGKYITNTDDGNFIITGCLAYTISDLFIAKIDQSGNLLFKIIFNDAGEGRCITQNADGSYVIGGMTNHLLSNNYSRDALIIKTKPENNWK